MTLPESDLKNLSLTIVSDYNELKAMPEHSPRHQRIFEGEGCVKCVWGLGEDSKRVDGKGVDGKRAIIYSNSS